MFFLQIRLWLLMTLLFAIVYAAVVIIGKTFLHVGDFYLYFGVSILMMIVQFLIGPKIVEWSMQVKYVKRQDYPRLFQMVEGMCAKAGMPMPKIGISPIDVPNAFAFGRGIRDGRVCLTQGIMRLLNDEELKAVLGHELSHLKNRDVLTITVLSVIPMILYRVAWHFLFYGRSREDRGANTLLLGVAAFLFYFITNLLVLYASRIREYFADQGSVSLGNNPHTLATSLYKLVYGSARVDKDSLKQVEGFKAFFVNDPSRAMNELKDIRQLDLDKSGTIDASELLLLRQKKIKLGVGDKMMELLSTHPNMLKRIKKLTDFQAGAA